MSKPTLKVLQDSLSSRYGLAQTRYMIGSRAFDITHIENTDTLLNDLIARGADDPEVLDERLPYWSEIWPSAIALSPFILESGLIEPSDQVIELGCGLGLPGIAAATQSERVLLTDYQEDALLFSRLNGLQNLDREIETAHLDWRNPQIARKADILLAADIVYEERFFAPILQTFDRFLTTNGHIMLSEPGRALAKPFFASLAEHGWDYIDYPIDVPGPTPITVTLYDIRRNTH